MEQANWFLSLNISHAMRRPGSGIFPMTVSIVRSNLHLSNPAFMLATHLMVSAEYRMPGLTGGRNVQRDRLSKFLATGSGAA